MSAFWRYVRGSLGLRISLMLVLVPCVGLVLAVDNWIDNDVMDAQIQQAYDQSLLEPAQALADAVTVVPGGVYLEMPFAVGSMFDATSSKSKHLAAQVTWKDPDDGRMRQRQLLGDGALPMPADSGMDAPLVPRMYDSTYDGTPIRVAVLARKLSVDGIDYRVTALAAESTGARRQALSVVRRQTLVRDVWQLMVVALLIWLSVGWTLRPLERLRESMHRHRGRPLEMLLDTDSVPQEVRPLAEVINQHAVAQREAVEDQARFLADASHQLRMPLAILFAQARYAVRETDPQRMRETLQAIIGQLDHSRRLAEQLLSLAHATQSAPMPGGVVDFNAIARGVVLQYLAMAHEKNIDLGWQDAREDAAGEGGDESPESVVPVQASDVEIHEVLANLVHNAIRCVPDGGSITVAVYASQAGEMPERMESLGGKDTEWAGNWVRAEVVDNGPGIDPERRENVFERFQREPSAQQDAGSVRGAGLGLSIARAYARRNGGDVQLHDTDPAARLAGKPPGLRAVFWLPECSSSLDRGAA